MKALRPWLDAEEALERARRALPAARSGVVELYGVRADRWEIRRADRVTLALTVTLRDADGAGERPLFVESRGARRARGAALGSGLVGTDPDGSTVWLSPADPKLALPGGTTPDGAPLARWRTRHLGHRLGRRSSLRWTRREPARGAGPSSALPDDLVAKRWARDGVAAALESGLRHLAARRLPFRVPRPLARDADGRGLLLDRLPGDTLHVLLLRGDEVPATALGVAWRAFQRGSPDGLTPWSVDDELATVRTLAGRVALLDPPLAARIRGTLARLTATVAPAVADGPLVPAHRDLHDKQVLHGPDGLAVLDWDLAVAAPAALDPGNFLAHLTLRALQGRIASPAASAARRAFLDGLAPTPATLGAWESLALVRLAAVYALRPAWPGLPDRLLQAATHTASRPQEVNR